MTDMTGRWSVMAGHSVGLMSHDMKGDGESEHLHMLSGRVQFLVFHASSVRMLRGRAISSRMLTMRSRRGVRGQSKLVTWSLCLASDVLWCRLKSPRRRMSVMGIAVHTHSLVSHSFAI